MFSCNFCEVFKDNFSLEAIGATASRSSSQAVCLDNKEIKLTSIVAIFFTILLSSKMLFVCWDKFGSHHPEQVLKISNMFKGNICEGVCCSWTIVITVDISCMSLLKSAGGVGSVVAWARGWRESNFGRGCVVMSVLKVLTYVKGNDKGWNFGLVETHDFVNFCYVSMKINCSKSRF